MDYISADKPNFERVVRRSVTPPPVTWGLGAVVKIKPFCEGEGKICLVLGAAVWVEQWWVPVLVEGAEDPDFYKLNALEPV